MGKIMQVSMLQIHMVHMAKSETMEYVCGHTLDEKLTSYLASYVPPDWTRT